MYSYAPVAVISVENMSRHPTYENDNGRGGGGTKGLGGHEDILINILTSASGLLSRRRVLRLASARNDDVCFCLAKLNRIRL